MSYLEDLFIKEANAALKTQSPDNGSDSSGGSGGAVFVLTIFAHHDEEKGWYYTPSHSFDEVLNAAKNGQYILIINRDESGVSYSNDYINVFFGDEYEEPYMSWIDNTYDRNGLNLAMNG